MMMPCLWGGPWHVTANVSLVPGTYILAFHPFGDGTFAINQTIHLVYPGDPPGTNVTMLASRCASQ
jgi:hypothetical protein